MSNVSRDKTLIVEPINAEGFSLFGTLINATEDGVPFGRDDAELELSQGIPRFYIMELGPRPHRVVQITRHRRVTQVLAAVGGKAWIIVVAPPCSDQSDLAKPDFSKMRAFEVPGDAAIKLHVGAWHAGPYFEGNQAKFFNLELSDTNIVDHHSWNLEDCLGYTPVLSSASTSP